MRKGRTLVGLGLAVIAMGTYTVLPAGATIGLGGGPIAESVLGSGSDTTQFMMSSLDQLYLYSPGCQQIAQSGTSQVQNYDFSCYAPDPAGTIKSENYQHDQVHQAYFLGSSSGIKQLCNQGISGFASINFARSSRAPSTSDCTGLHFVAYARDGIPTEVFRNFTNNGTDAGPCAGKTNCFSQQQLKDIFHLCTITDWHQIDSSIASGTLITMYTPQTGSGTRSTFDNFMGGTNFSETCIDSYDTRLGTTGYQTKHVVPENQNVSINSNGDASTTVFPFSFGVWSTQIKGAGGSLLTSIDGITATAKTIGNLTFPYGRYLFNVFCAAAVGTGCAANGVTASQATINYVGEEGWICKPGTGTWASDGGPHTINPVTKHNYQTDIAKAIKAFGFVPLPLQVIGGGDTKKDFCSLFTT
jgi:ABC-type phosphate transport system substrate-binding protein